MNETPPAKVEATPEDATARRKVSEWWNSLTTKAKKAVLRKRQRTETKKARRRETRRAQPTGHQCPRCWEWSRTPEERAAHRPVHHQVETAP